MKGERLGRLGRLSKRGQGKPAPKIRPMRQPPPPPPKPPRRTPTKPFPRIQATKKRPTTEPFTRPRGKPHGPHYPIQKRCPLCGYIVNDKKRFTWDHKFQTFIVTFGGRLPGGKGVIDYKEVEDPEYLPMMRDAVRRLAERLGVLGRAQRR